jgi:hypothetical protein
VQEQEHNAGGAAREDAAAREDGAARGDAAARDDDGR